jgi:hypothetical protein
VASALMIERTMSASQGCPLPYPQKFQAAVICVTQILNGELAEGPLAALMWLMKSWIR